MIDDTINDAKTVAGGRDENIFSFWYIYVKDKKGDTLNCQHNDSQIVKRSHL